MSICVAREASVPLQVSATGHVVASSSVVVRSQVDGMLNSVHFQEGDAIRVGELLFTVDSKPFETSLAEAKANLEKDLALAKNAKSEQAQNAELLRSKIISRENYEESVALAQSLESTLAADRAAVDSAELALSYCAIRSPIKGRAGMVLVSPGNLVNNQETPLLTINQTQPIYVDLDLPEQQLASVRKCMGAGRLKVEAYLPGQVNPVGVGELTSIDNQVNISSGTIRARAVFSNPDEVLWPGQLVITAITLNDTTHAISVPAAALETQGPRSTVLVVTPAMQLQRRHVELGGSMSNTVFLLSGVAPGEKVVACPTNGLAPGMRVSVAAKPIGQN